MSILTVLLVAIPFAAWKAPRWVKDIGSIALTVGFLDLFLGLRQMFSALFTVAKDLGDGVTGLFDIISPGVFFGALRVAMIPLCYAIIIYLVSLVVHIIQKPRL